MVSNAKTYGKKATRTLAVEFAKLEITSSPINGIADNLLTSRKSKLIT